MGGKVNVYNLGALGVNLVDGPIHMKDGALLQCQNAMAMPIEAQIALVKRPGMDFINNASSSILHIQSFLQKSLNPHDAFLTPGLAWSSMRFASALGRFVAVGGDATNQVIYSDDGVTWTKVPGSLPIGWNSVDWSPSLGLFVAVANGSTGGTTKIMTSPDGITWTTRNAADGNVDWSGVAWSPDLAIFAAVSETGTIPTALNTSANGTAWTSRTSVLGGWRKIVWAPTLLIFVACGYKNAGAAHFMTSANGILWTDRVTTINTTFNDVVYVPSLSLLVAVGSGPGPTHSVATSPDGITWTGRAVPGTPDFWGVEYSSDLGLLIATGDNGYWASQNAIDWWRVAGTGLTGFSRGSDLAWSSSLALFGAGGFFGTESLKVG